MILTSVRVLIAAVLTTGFLAVYSAAARAQSPAQGATPGVSGDQMLLTVFLRHDESKPLPDINAELKRNGYYEAFPPAGVEVVSWYVVMGIGQVVTLRFPASRLREVNTVLEKTAWGAYRTEFYPTYDYKALAEEARRRASVGDAQSRDPTSLLPRDNSKTPP